MNTQSHQGGPASADATSYLWTAQTIIKNFVRPALPEEFSQVERFLFRISLLSACREGWTQAQREDFNYSFFQCRSILKILFNCESDSITSINKSLDEILFFLDSAGVEKNIARILGDFRIAMDNYFQSDWFDDDVDRCDMIVLFDQEWERFLTQIRPVLIRYRDSDRGTTIPGEPSFKQQPGDLMDLTNPTN